MKIKLVGILAAVAMLVGMLAVPAAANPTFDVGVYTGTAQVGKTGVCNQDGTANIGGAGLGLPVANGHKNAVYKFAGSVTSIGTFPTVSTGVITACGYLTEQLDKLGLGLGAACGASKGYGGQGKIVFGTGTQPDASLSNIEWKISYGSFFIVTADVQDFGKTKNAGELVSIIRAAPPTPQDCTTKSGSGASKTGGMTSFAVTGAYVVLPAPGTIDQNLPVITCKDTNDDLCLYNTKKQG